jgi:hypothetical protein
VFCQAASRIEARSVAGEQREQAHPAAIPISSELISRHSSPRPIGPRAFYDPDA